MNVLIRICLLLWYIRPESQGLTSSLSPRRPIRQAVTWYKVARATENSMEAHLERLNSMIWS